MKTLNEIKQMMVAGETAKADASLKELLAAEPKNLQAKILYGTCRQLLGDEETFKRIHDELAPEMEKLADDPTTADTIVLRETISLWRKYHALWMTLIIGGLVLASGILAVGYYGKVMRGQFDVATSAEQCLYAGPEYFDKNKNSSESSASKKWVSDVDKFGTSE